MSNDPFTLDMFGSSALSSGLSAINAYETELV